MLVPRNNFDSSLSLFNRNYLFNKNSQPYLDTSPNITLDILDINIYSECNSLKCFYNQAKLSFDHFKLFSNEETIDFKFNFYK